MNIQIKAFEELTCRELYEILQLRSEVFIVEQQGCYLDPDGIDCRSVHIFAMAENGSCAGCLRIFPGEDPGTVQIGRLVVRDRRRGLGTVLMDQARQEAVRRYGARRLFLTGRRSARPFYESLGYTAALPACYHTEAEAAYFDFSLPLI